MPIYDFKCGECHVVTEKIVPSTVVAIRCPECKQDGDYILAERQLSCPGGLKVNGRMVVSQSQMRLIKEPVWQYPDGSIESVH